MAKPDGGRSSAAFKSTGLPGEDDGDDGTTCCGGGDLKKGAKGAGGAGAIISGGVGTLIVRVVQARNLPAATGGGFFSSGTSNPYCLLEFEGQMHMTSVMTSTVDPVWPREQFFFEVKMPAFHAGTEEAAATLKMVGGGGKGRGADHHGGVGVSFSSTEPHLHVKLMHSSQESGRGGGGGGGGVKSPARAGGGNSPAVSDPTLFTKPGAKAMMSMMMSPNDKVLGETFVNIVDLATARKKAMDGWFNLSDGGAVKLTVEYDVLDAVPLPGEMVRLLGFGSSADLWPLPLREELKVEGYVDEHRERLLVSYRTSEGWKCTAEVHRFHVISAGRHKSIINDYQNKVLDAAISFMDTPLMAALGGALDRVEEEGLAAVGSDVWEGLKRGASRWYSLGLGTAMQDVKYAVGLTTPTSNEQEQQQAAGGGGRGGTAETKGGGRGVAQEEEYVFDMVPRELLDRVMCPITGAPMRDPVVAADGHTYEREAIERWFLEHESSPMTGAKLETSMVFRNHALAATIQELKSQNEALRKAAAAQAKEEGGGSNTTTPAPLVVGGGKKEDEEDSKKSSSSSRIGVVEEEGGESKQQQARPPSVVAPLGGSSPLHSKEDNKAATIEDVAPPKQRDESSPAIIPSGAAAAVVVGAGAEEGKKTPPPPSSTTTPPRRASPPPPATTTTAAPTTEEEPAIVPPPSHGDVAEPSPASIFGSHDTPAATATTTTSTSTTDALEEEEEGEEEAASLPTAATGQAAGGGDDSSSRTAVASSSSSSSDVVVAGVLDGLLDSVVTEHHHLLHDADHD